MGEIVSSFFSKLIQWIEYGLTYCAGMLVGILDASTYYVSVVFLGLFNLIFDVLETLLDSSGLDDFVETINAPLEGGLGYYLDLMLVPEAITATVGAYFVRFLIRRLPVVG